MKKLIALLGAAALVTAQRTVTVTETPPASSTSTVLITSTQFPTTSSPTSEISTFKFATYKGRGEYVTVYDPSGSAGGDDMYFGISIIGSQGPSTTYEIVPTIYMEFPKDDGKVSTAIYNARTVTVAPSTYIMSEVGLDRGDSGTATATYGILAISCSITTTPSPSPTAICSATILNPLSSSSSDDNLMYPANLNNRTITQTSLAYQTYEVVDKVSATGKDEVVTALTTRSSIAGSASATIVGGGGSESVTGTTSVTRSSLSASSPAAASTTASRSSAATHRVEGGSVFSISLSTGMLISVLQYYL